MPNTYQRAARARTEGLYRRSNGEQNFTTAARVTAQQALEQAASTAVERLRIDWDTAIKVVSRDVTACEGALAASEARSDEDAIRAARIYLRLARAGAPQGVHACDRCTDGLFYVNTERGPTPRGKCFRCEGKSYQTAEDRKRNAYYDNHVMRVHV